MPHVLNSCFKVINLIFKFKSNVFSDFLNEKFDKQSD